MITQCTKHACHLGACPPPPGNFCVIKVSEKQSKGGGGGFGMYIDKKISYH